MSIKTQGTELFVLVSSKTDPTKKEVMQVKGMTAFNPGGNPADQIEDTPLEAQTKTFLNGLRTPGEATFNINCDPNVESHTRLHEYSESENSEILNWAAGWSDGKSVPTINTAGDGFELPEDRTWFTFAGAVKDFPFTFEGNSIVKTEVPITRSGGGKWTRKSK